MSPPLVRTPEALAQVVEALTDRPRYTLDTEFHRERTYFPQLALVQIAWDGGAALIDPLAVDVEALAPVLNGPGTAVIHAADQDLEVLERACGTIPSHLFDTQVAAGFVGYGTPSLSALVDGELHLRLPKGDRLTDWLARPLDEAQLDYAASDVEHLLELADRLSARLADMGRTEWAADECELARTKARGRRDPRDAWRRIKEVRQLKGRPRAVARELAAWREEQAAATDQPVRFVLADLAVVSISQKQPTTVEELRGLRGVDGRHVKGGAAQGILEAVARGRAGDPPSDAAPKAELDRDLRAAVALVAAWVNQLARDLSLDASLLATRGDVEAFLRGDDDCRLRSGWRSEVAGEPIRRLVTGDAAVAFEDGRLVLEDRARA